MVDQMQRLKQNLGVIERKPFDVSKLAAELGEEPRLPLLETRQQTHGSFEDNAIISQALKSFLRASPGWGRLTDIERESMDQIALKFSRILSGKSMSKAHWEDVHGYAGLVLERCV